MSTKLRTENLKGRRHSEHLGVDEKIIIRMELRDIGTEGVEWMHLAQDEDQ
jgi:hypothetical protein